MNRRFVGGYGLRSREPFRDNARNGFGRNFNDSAVTPPDNRSLSLSVTLEGCPNTSGQRLGHGLEVVEQVSSIRIVHKSPLNGSRYAAVQP